MFCQPVPRLATAPIAFWLWRIDRHSAGGFLGCDCFDGGTRVYRTPARINPTKMNESRQNNLTAMTSASRLVAGRSRRYFSPIGIDVMPTLPAEVCMRCLCCDGPLLRNETGQLLVPVIDKILSARRGSSPSRQGSGPYPTSSRHRFGA